MSLTAGARLGLYEGIGALGAGGMGEVYRARCELRAQVGIRRKRLMNPGLKPDLKRALMNCSRVAAGSRRYRGDYQFRVDRELLRAAVRGAAADHLATLERLFTNVDKKP